MSGARTAAFLLWRGLDAAPNGEFASGISRMEQEAAPTALLAWCGNLAGWGRSSPTSRLTKRISSASFLLVGFRKFRGGASTRQRSSFLTGHMSAWNSALPQALFGYPLHFLVRARQPSRHALVTR